MSSNPTEANESTPLILQEKNAADDSVDPENGSSGESVPSNDFDHYVDVADELEKPWPATFERSISLLAGPTMDTTFIENVTKSPKITPNLSRRRQFGSFATPETLGGALRPRNEFTPGITKIQSLDFGNVGKRDSDAKLYRMKVLEAKNKIKKRPTTESKMSEDLKQKKKNQDAGGGGHGVDIGEKASFGQCTFNMANILMGVGLLGLPYIFKSAGWFGGLFVTLSFSSIAYRTSILLGRELNGDPRSTSLFDDSAKFPLVRKRKPIKSFPDIAREAFGQFGTVLLSFVLYFELFSCLCIFYVTIGDHLHTLFPLISMQQHMIYTSFVLTIPTALLRTPKLLSYLSAVGTVATAFVVSTVFGAAIVYGDVSETIAENRGIDNTSTPNHILWKTGGLPIAFGLIAYTFSGHAIIPSIYSSMARPQDYEKMIGLTFSIVTLCCIAVAVSGYLMFGSIVDDQVTLTLESYSGNDNIIMKMLTWLMILTAFSKFTLTAFPLALGFEEIIAPAIPNDGIMEFVSSIIKLFLVASSLAVAIFVPSFSVLCSLVGLICTMIVSVIFPAAAHLKMFGDSLSLWDKALDWLFIIGGTLMAVLGTISTTQG